MIIKNMWHYLRNPLLALSLGLNLAFAAIWLGYTETWRFSGQESSYPAGGNHAISSPLHREIGVTPEQWERMEPIINEFQEKAQKQRQWISSLRSELMDLLTMPVVDETAIRSKQEQILAGQRQMQNLVIGHLLEEREILTPNQTKKLMQTLCEQCRREGGMSTKGGFGRVLDERSRNGAADLGKMKQ